MSFESERELLREIMKYLKKTKRIIEYLKKM